MRILLRGRVIFYFHVFHEFLCTVRPWGILRTPDCIPLEYRPSLGSHNNLELILQLQPFCLRRNSSRNQSKSGGQGRWFQPLFQLPEALAPISNNILGQDKNLNTFLNPPSEAEQLRSAVDGVTNERCRIQKITPTLRRILKLPPSYNSQSGLVSLTLYRGFAKLDLRSGTFCIIYTKKNYFWKKYRGDSVGVS